jgi:outer membrane protein assembly factor BamB
MSSARIGTCLILLMVAISGCAHKYHLSRQAPQGSPWPYFRGDLAATGAFTGGSFGGKLDILWEYKSNDKPAAPLTIAGGSLVYPGAKNRIKFLDLVTGEYQGYIKTKSNPQTGLVVADSLAFFAIAPKRNVLYCRNLHNGHVVWARPVKDAVFGSIIVNNRLIIGSGEGVLAALDPYTGEVHWSYRSDSRFTAPPAYGDGKIFQPANDGTLYVISAADGTESYRVKVGGPMVNAVAVPEHVYGGDVDGNVFCIDPDDGRIMWKVRLEGPIWTAPAVSGDQVYVGHSGGQLVALDGHSGQRQWDYDAVDVIKASATASGDYVIAGTMGGMLYSFEGRTGALVEQRDLGAAIAFPPVTDGHRVYVATQSGRIICFGEQNEALGKTDQ